MLGFFPLNSTHAHTHTRLQINAKKLLRVDLLKCKSKNKKFLTKIPDLIFSPQNPIIICVRVRIFFSSHALQNATITVNKREFIWTSVAPTVQFKLFSFLLSKRWKKEKKLFKFFKSIDRIAAAPIEMGT